MAFEKLSDRVRHCIGENDPRAAAELLVQAFRDKNPQLFNIALVQQANAKKLADQSAAGILSADEINREQAKINAALLHLSDEYARLFETAAAPAPALPRQALLAAAGLLALVFLGWLAKNIFSGPVYPDTFDLTVRLHEPGGDHLVVRDGQVGLRLGDAEPRERQPLDTTGTATFRELPQKYRGDSVLLLYYPPRQRAFKVSAQSAEILSGKDETIVFTLEFAPDTTAFEATLWDSKGRTVPGAQITIDGNLHTVSDANGYFRAAIPKPGGAAVNLMIVKNGKRLYEGDVTISAGHRKIPVE